MDPKPAKKWDWSWDGVVPFLQGIALALLLCFAWRLTDRMSDLESRLWTIKFTAEQAEKRAESSSRDAQETRRELWRLQEKNKVPLTP